jgi:hypothetical protein
MARGVAMAKRLSERAVASGRLLVLELSEDGLMVLAVALTILKQPTRQSMTD